MSINPHAQAAPSCGRACVGPTQWIACSLAHLDGFPRQAGRVESQRDDVRRDGPRVRDVDGVGGGGGQTRSPVGGAHHLVRPRFVEPRVRECRVGQAPPKGPEHGAVVVEVRDAGDGGRARAVRLQLRGGRAVSTATQPLCDFRRMNEPTCMSVMLRALTNAAGYVVVTSLPEGDTSPRRMDTTACRGAALRRSTHRHCRVCSLSSSRLLRARPGSARQE